MLIAGDEIDITGTTNFKGSMLPWKNYKNLERYNPARHDLLSNWTTPMLVIHSDMDYRCIVSDGIAAYGVCQILGTPSKFLNFPDEVNQCPLYAAITNLPANTD
jgi:dipeptidyl aminopeptidase/acylaminoacyl peptidase